MNIKLRTIISLLVAMIAMVAIYFTMPNYQLAPQGILLPAHNQQQPPYQGEVNIYTSLSAPLYAATIGNISVEYHNAMLPASQTQIIDEAKHLAAQAGGNGIIFFIGHAFPANPSMEKLVLQGMVIKTELLGR